MKQSKCEYVSETHLCVPLGVESTGVSVTSSIEMREGGGAHFLTLAQANQGHNRGLGVKPSSEDDGGDSGQDPTVVISSWGYYSVNFK